MNIIQSILTKNPCYTAGKKIEVKGLMLHSVGCPQPKASVFVNSWNKSSFNSACVHAFVDAITGDVYQTLPWDHRGWHCGAYANNTHIGVEMCEPDCIKYTGGSSFTCSNTARAKEMVQKAYNSSVELFAFLCEKYNLDPTKKGVIISHKEGHAMGWASNHGDPEHLWKQLNMGYTMDTFRQAVKDCMTGDHKEDVTAPDPEKTPAEPSAEASTSFPATPFIVKVIIPDLNYRSAPSMSGTVKGQTGKGSFTITEVSGDWGKLKSGAGWIFLANPKYCTINSAVQKKSVEAIAKEVIQGKWGNGEDRKRRLTEAGYSCSEVQNMVNKLLAK